MNPKLEVYEQPCPLFVPLVEEMWLNDPVTKVPITPILPFFVVCTATLAPGFTTPIIGTSTSFETVSKASALAVLQATTIAFTCFDKRNLIICLEYAVTVSFDLLP